MFIPYEQVATIPCGQVPWPCGCERKKGSRSSGKTEEPPAILERSQLREESTLVAIDFRY